jgi:hypothetical protein
MAEYMYIALSGIVSLKRLRILKYLLERLRV